MIRFIFSLWEININAAVKKAVIIKAAGLFNRLSITGMEHAPVIEPREI